MLSHILNYKESRPHCRIVCSADFFRERQAGLDTHVLVTRSLATLEPLKRRLAEQPVRLSGIALIETTGCSFSFPENRCYDWLLFTSINGALHFMPQLESWRHSGVAFPRIMAVGPATAVFLQGRGYVVSAMPTTYSGTEAVQELLRLGLDSQQTVLWPCGNLANPEVKVLLDEANVPCTELVVYETATRQAARQELSDIFQAEPPTILAFTSPSSVEAFAQLRVGETHRSEVIIAIGPTTAEAAQARFGQVDVVADPHTLDGLGLAIERYLAEREERWV